MSRSTSKGIAPGHPLRGEEWLGGPYGTLVALDAYRDSLPQACEGREPARRSEDGCLAPTGCGRTCFR